MINFTSVTKVLINSRQVYLHPSFKHPLQRYDFHRLLVKIRKDLIKAGVNEQARESVVWIELAFDPRIPKTFSTSFSTRAVGVIFHGGGKNAWSSEDRTKPLITSAEDLTRFSRLTSLLLSLFLPRTIVSSKLFYRYSSRLINRLSTCLSSRFRFKPSFQQLFLLSLSLCK